eukprot:317930-Chlamydomonas_euryale.AAC.2
MPCSCKVGAACPDHVHANASPIRSWLQTPVAGDRVQWPAGHPAAAALQMYSRLWRAVKGGVVSNTADSWQKQKNLLGLHHSEEGWGGRPLLVSAPANGLAPPIAASATHAPHRRLTHGLPPLCRCAGQSGHKCSLHPPQPPRLWRRDATAGPGAAPQEASQSLQHRATSCTSKVAAKERQWGLRRSTGGSLSNGAAQSRLAAWNVQACTRVRNFWSRCGIRNNARFAQRLGLRV